MKPWDGAGFPFTPEKVIRKEEELLENKSVSISGSQNINLSFFLLKEIFLNFRRQVLQAINSGFDSKTRGKVRYVRS